MLIVLNKMLNKYKCRINNKFRYVLQKITHNDSIYFI